MQVSKRPRMSSEQVLHDLPLREIPEMRVRFALSEGV